MGNEKIARDVILWIEEEINNNREAGITINDNEDKVNILTLISELLINQILEEAKENYAIKHKNQTNMEIVERTCKECGQLTKVGKTTGECLKCLDWKMGDLRK